MFNSSSGIEITFQVMAVAGQSARNQHTVSPILQGLQNIDGVYLASTWHLYDLDGGWIIQAHGTRQICSGISAVMTAKSNDLGIKIFHKYLLYPCSALTSRALIFSNVWISVLWRIWIA